MSDGFLVGRQPHRPLPGLAQILNCLGRDPSLLKVQRQLRCDLGGLLPVQRLQGTPHRLVQVRPFHRVQLAVQVLLEQDVPEPILGQALPAGVHLPNTPRAHQAIPPLQLTT